MFRRPELITTKATSINTPRWSAAPISSNNSTPHFCRKRRKPFIRVDREIIACHYPQL
jgi:hypothetical protein